MFEEVERLRDIRKQLRVLRSQEQSLVLKLKDRLKPGKYPGLGINIVAVKGGWFFRKCSNHLRLLPLGKRYENNP